MADRRRVSVHLALEIAEYVKGASGAATATRKVKSQIEDLGDEADDAGRDMTQLAANTDIAAHAVDDLGDEARVTAAELMLLEKQINSVNRASLSMGMNQSKGHPVAANAARGLRSTIVEMPSALSNVGSPRMRTALIGVLVGAAVAAAPTMGAIIAGVVAGAIGTVGVGGGLLMAAKDPRVQGAARRFGDSISQEFFRGGDAFVEPAINAMAILDRAFKDMEVPEAFEKMAPHVATIAEGLGDLGRNVMPGLNKAFDRMGPFADAAADGFADLGDGLSTFMDDVTRSEGAVTGLRTAFHLINGLILMTGKFLHFLSEAFLIWVDAMRRAALAASMYFAVMNNAESAAAMARLARQLGDILNPTERLPAATTAAGEAAKGASASWVPYATQVEIVKNHLEDLNRELEESISNMLAQDNANLGLQESMMDFAEAIKENGKNWDTTTEKGQANTRALLDAVGAAERKRQADIEMGKGSEEATRKANDAYNRTIRKLEEMATKAGLSGVKLRDLVGDYYVNVHYRTTGSFYIPPSGVLESKGRAAGGPVNAGEVYRVHEQGLPEWFRPNMSGTVIPLSGMQSATAGRSSTTMTVAPVYVTVGGPRSAQIAFDEFVSEVGKRGGTLAVIGVR